MKQVFINLPVADVEKSMHFYTRLGFVNNPQFSDEQSKCMVWSEAIYVMIMSHEKFNGFVHKPVGDTRGHIAAIFSLSMESVEAMNAMVERGLEAGGTEPAPMTDYGFMQLRRLEDPDGHYWEMFFMDMSKFASA